jgi:hypothetical protein
MNLERGAVFGTIGVIVLFAIVSGPLVPGVEFAGEPQSEDVNPGVGSLNVSVVHVPDDGYYLQKGEFGTGVYYLNVSDAVVDVESVEGEPILTYKIKIEELKYSRQTVHFLDDSSDGRMNLSIESDDIDKSVIDQESYEATIIIIHRFRGGTRTIFSKNVTVKVRE